MIRRYLIAVLFVLLIKNLSAQNLAALDSLAEIYLRTNYDSALKVLDQELILAKKESNSRYIVKANRQLGYANYFLAKYDKSLSYYLEALKVAEPLKMNDELLLIYNLIGTEYKKINKPSEAKLWFRKGLSLAEMENKTEYIAGFYNDIGLVYQLEQLPDSAYSCFNKALNIYRNDHNSIGESYSLDYLSELETNRGNFAKGIEFIKQSVATRERLNDKNALAIALNNTGEIYSAWGKQKEAIEYFLKSAELSKQIRYHDLYQYTTKQLYKCYKTTGNIDQALFYFEESARIKDSIINEKNLKNLNELDAKYQSEKKQIQINSLNSENKLKAEKIKQQNYAMILFVSLLCVLAVSIILIVRNSKKIKQAYKIINKQKEQVERQNVQLEVKQKEILDSIHYASRIQNSLLTTEKFIDRTLRRMLGK
jgi:tetratricopeptide (TPR) repeat protein